MALPEFTTLQWIIAIIAGLLVGLSKSGFAGMGVFTVLLMAMIIPPRESTGTVLPLLLAGDCLAVWYFRHHANWYQIRRLLAPAVVGVLIGFVLMPMISDTSFGRVIGILMVLIILIQYLVRWIKLAEQNLPRSHTFAWGMGISAGIATMLANLAGPIMIIYLLAQRLPKYEFVATGAVYYLIINLFKIPFSAALGLIDGGSILLNLILLPTVVFGFFIGRAFLKKIPQKWFEEIVLFLALLGALRLIWL